MPIRSSAERVRAHRADMRARGYKLVQRWVPDTGSPAFRDELVLSVRLNNAAPDEAETMAWLEDAQAGLDLGTSPDLLDGLR